MKHCSYTVILPRPTVIYPIHCVLTHLWRCWCVVRVKYPPNQDVKS